MQYWENLLEPIFYILYGPPAVIICTLGLTIPAYNWILGGKFPMNDFVAKFMYISLILGGGNILTHVILNLR